MGMKVTGRSPLGVGNNQECSFGLKKNVALDSLHIFPLLDIKVVILSKCWVYQWSS